MKEELSNQDFNSVIVLNTKDFNKSTKKSARDRSIKKESGKDENENELLF